MRIGVIGTPGGWSSERLADEVAEITGFRLLISMEETALDLENGRLFHGDLDLSSLDGLLIKKIGAHYSPDLLDRLEMLRFLHQGGLPIFSSPLAIMRVVDRLSCTVTLRAADIPMPPTTITEDIGLALATVQRYGEAVFKPLFSSKARGMMLIGDGPYAEAQIAAFRQENQVMYIQKKIAFAGRDLGLVFLGGHYLTTYARCKTNETAWNTTTASGGRYEPHTPSAELIALASRAQALFDLDFTCVDIVESEDGPMVFEVSAFGGFRGIQATSDLNPARLFADHAIARINP